MSARTQIQNPRHKTWILTDLGTKSLRIVVFFDAVYRKRDDMAALRVLDGLIAQPVEHVSIHPPGIHVYAASDHTAEAISD